MNIAKIESGLIVETGDVSVVFPNTSFPAGGPSLDWLKENSCLPLFSSRPFDPNTQELVTVPPYIDGEEVFTAEVRELTPEQIAERAAAALQAKRSMMNVTPFQAKAALLQAGQLDAVESAIKTATDPLIGLAWTNAIEYRRLSPMVDGIGKELSWTDLELDQLFEVAAQITA